MESCDKGSTWEDPSRSSGPKFLFSRENTKAQGGDMLSPIAGSTKIGMPAAWLPLSSQPGRCPHKERVLRRERWSSTSWHTWKLAECDGPVRMKVGMNCHEVSRLNMNLHLD